MYIIINVYKYLMTIKTRKYYQILKTVFLTKWIYFQTRNIKYIHKLPSRILKMQIINFEIYIMKNCTLNMIVTTYSFNNSMLVN